MTTQSHLNDPQIIYPIGDFTLDFQNYIKECKKILSTHRLDFNENRDAIIEANCPYELTPVNPMPSRTPGKLFKKGVLLVHGLLDTPFFMKDIGKIFQQQGLLVRAIALPGHATIPGALLNVKYEDWLQAIRYGIESLKKDVDEIYLAGFSTGASLCVYQALSNTAPNTGLNDSIPTASSISKATSVSATSVTATSVSATPVTPTSVTATSVTAIPVTATPIAGLFLFSPAFKIHSFFDFALNWQYYLNSIIPIANWFYQGEENDYTKYHSVAFNAVYQVYKLSRALKKLIQTQPALTCPIFMSLSNEDLIVSSKESIKFFKSDKNPASRMILYRAKRKKFRDPRIIVRSSRYPNLHIKNFSHICIPIAPDNPHYGKHGDYSLASHVEESKNVIYCALDKPRKYFLDLLYKSKLVKHQYQRLTFNPDFEFLAENIANMFD